VSAEIRYRPGHLTIVVPTYKRPFKLGNLLESVALQRERIGRMIVVDGHTDAEDVVNRYRDRIEILYLRCDPPGQIRQRNLGLAQLTDRDVLVGLLDDDIVLEPASIDAMIEMWNSSPSETAGICFNLVNESSFAPSAIGRLLGTSGTAPGQVLRSGQTTSIGHVDRNYRVHWLPGGATVWKREVLMQRQHPVQGSARWAIGEDLLFSYPIGKTRPLFAAVNARARHEHEADYGRADQSWYHGRTQTVWMYHFAATNPDLSPAMFVMSTVARMAGKFVLRGVLRGDAPSRRFAQGQARALYEILMATLRGRPSADLLSDPV
jgi:glycosyltransferase involved in cell wall biosynthesis